jgi:hypothetical protein
MLGLTRVWRTMFGVMEDLLPCCSTWDGMVGRSFYYLILGVVGVLKVVDMCVRVIRNDADYMGIHLH